MTSSSKIFAIGLGKTGTSSMTKALSILGINVVHYPWDATTYDELRRCQYRLTLLETCQAITDISIAPFYAELDREYPGSKFLLTVRDKESWLESIGNHRKWLMSYWQHDIPDKKRFDEFINACVYGCGVGMFDRDRFSHVYDAHVRNVQEYFRGRPDDLLVVDICAGQGWEKLCPFLGLDTPAEPFPHANPRGD